MAARDDLAEAATFMIPRLAKCEIVAFLLAKIWSYMDHVMYIYKDLHMVGSFCSARSFE